MHPGSHESPNPRRVAAGRRNWLKRKGLTPDSRERLRQAAFANRPWQHATGPRTAEGKGAGCQEPPACQTRRRVGTPVAAGTQRRERPASKSGRLPSPRLCQTVGFQPPLSCRRRGSSNQSRPSSAAATVDSIAGNRIWLGPGHLQCLANRVRSDRRCASRNSCSSSGSAERRFDAAVRSLALVRSSCRRSHRRPRPVADGQAEQGQPKTGNRNGKAKDQSWWPAEAGMPINRVKLFMPESKPEPVPVGEG